MPDTGFGPFGGVEPGSPIDNSGGGIDPSYSNSLAPGGYFPGSDANWLGYQQGNPYGTPGYTPGWLSNLLSHTRAGPLINGITGNIQSPGAGQAPSLPGGYPYQGFSGPGAAYGPASGPTRGLLDQGRPVDSAWDSPETRPPGGNDAGPAAKPKGGGGHKGTNFAGAYQPYQGIQSHPQFVDWQPTPFGQQPAGPTRFVGGGPSSTSPATAAPAPGKPGKGGKGGGKAPVPGPGGVGGGAGGRGGGAGAGRHPGPAAAGPGAASRPPGATAPAGAPMQGIDHPIAGQMVNHPDLRAGIFGGVDTNYLDYRTPSWLRDPTTGTYNTSGFPNQTPFAPNSNNRGGPNQAFDQYVTALHDAGFGTDDIMSLVGPYGYRLSGSGDWQWGWGSGPVVSTGTHGGGYTFARDASGGGKGTSEKPNAADRLTQGWTPTGQYV